MSVMKDRLIVKKIMLDDQPYVHIHGIAGCDLWVDVEDAHELQLLINRVLRQIKRENQ